MKTLKECITEALIANDKTGNSIKAEFRVLGAAFNKNGFTDINMKDADVLCNKYGNKLETNRGYKTVKSFLIFGKEENILLAKYTHDNREIYMQFIPDVNKLKCIKITYFKLLKEIEKINDIISYELNDECVYQFYHGIKDDNEVKE